MQRTGGEQNHAQHDLDHRQIIARCFVAPSPHHAFDEIQPDKQADPAVGEHAIFQQPRQRNAQRQHFEDQERAAWSNGREPQLPQQTQHNQAEQAADSGYARQRHVFRGGGG